MPKEVRYILFQAHEAEEALLAHLSPPDALVGLRVTAQLSVEFLETPRFGVGAVVTGLVDPAGSKRLRRVDQTELLSALLAWCDRARVPLPRRATKGLELLGGTVALTVTMNAVPTETIVSGNRISYADPQLRTMRPAG